MAPTRPTKPTSKARPSAAPPKRPSKSTSGIQKPPPKSKRPTPPVSAHNSDDDDDDENNEAAAKPYRPNRLKARIRSVPRHVVSDKWMTLSPACQEDVMATVKLAERGVLLSFPSERTKTQAQAVTQRLTAVLRKKLEKIPVPPIGKDARLSRDFLMGKNVAAETALEPTLREIAELEKELEKEKELLRQDEAHLAELRKNAKAQEQIRAEKSRLMPRSLRMNTDASPPPDIKLSTDYDQYEASAAAYKPENDRHIRALVEQFEGHLQTMHGNANILGGVPDWVWKARTAVEDVLGRIDDGLLEKVAGV
ncbi:hypothetical protein EX30DRAFT_339410 [Ascodesmis nigricans]|uniref:Kinetochore protein fta7 n=1 Tax=Ascodesmis nigricans TaxID=341454 RepID=A0A4S2N216_9PEZI|nr:hypothetical protein EX30DRAFT_339410 [Ascodesmis nigricans]